MEIHPSGSFMDACAQTGREREKRMDTKLIGNFCDYTIILIMLK
jgi:hypothetical protein